MSLIEAAVRKAKEKLAAEQQKEAPERPVPSSQSPDSGIGEATDAEPRRVLPVAPVRTSIMEVNGVLPQVRDVAAQRAYRVLRTRVRQRMLANGWHTLAVTACGMGEGKTLTAINLAISMASDSDTPIYLVDMDLQRPKISSYFGLQFQKGLSDYIDGEAVLDEIVYSPGVEGLAIVPNSRSIELSSDVLGSPRIQELCRSLSAERPRPLVIFDLPPLLIGDDVIKFSPHFDTMLFVVSEGTTPRATLKRATEALKELSVIGVVLNRSAEGEEAKYY